MRGRRPYPTTSAYTWWRAGVRTTVRCPPRPRRKWRPQIPVARILPAEQILALFLDHVFEQHPAQLGYRALLIAEPEEAMDVAKFMKLVFRPPLKLLLGKLAAKEELPDGMRLRVALL